MTSLRCSVGALTPLGDGRVIVCLARFPHLTPLPLVFEVFCGPVSREGGNFGPLGKDPGGLSVMILVALVYFAHPVGVMGFSGPT